VRPGVGFFRDNGGLGSVVGWSGPLIAGSSAWAFDPASRGGRVGVDTASVISPFDGATLRLAPEGVVEAQVALGFDIAATLDWPDSSARLGRGEAVSRRRLAWAERSLAARPMGVALLAGVAAAAPVEEIRELGRLPFDGFVLNGIVHAEIELTETQVAVTELARLLDRALGELPVGVLRVVDWRGDLPGLSDLIETGIDLVRLPGEADRASARLVLTADGQVDATTDAWRDDPSPLDPDCRCPTCSQHSRAYVRHLAIANELLAFRLIERHNLAWFMRAVSGDLPGPSVQ
jgi:queuine tRNA-ribosyltransferase